MKKLVIQTSNGTRNYSLFPTSQGYDVYRVVPGFFSSSKRLVGHGSNTENAILVARTDAGDSTVKSTRLHG